MIKVKIPKQSAMPKRSSGATSPMPIRPELVVEHIERARQAIARAGVDGMLLFRDSNILGFTGVPLAPSDRLVCALLNRDGELALVVPAFEADLASSLPSGGRLFPWREDEDAFSAAAS